MADKLVNTVRPWIDHYPDGMGWEFEVDLTPVHEQVLAACDRHGDKTALDFLGAETSYADLGRSIRNLSGALQKHYGVTKGTRVALLLPNTPFYPIAYYAILLAGGTIVNCNPLYTTAELNHVVESAGAELMITTDLKLTYEKAEEMVQAGHIKDVIVAHFPNALPGIKKYLFKLAKGGDLTRVSGSSISGKTRDFHDLVDENITPEPAKIDAKKDVAVQQYTGGTTGLPKGAMLSHANIAANLSQIDHYGCGVFHPPAKVVAILPFFHIFAMTVCMNTPLANGSEVVMMPRFDVKDFGNLLRRKRPTVLPSVPTLLGAIAKASSITTEDLKSLEVSISGGAALPADTRAAFAKKTDTLLVEGYGLTEASPVITCGALRQPSKPMSIGQPLPATDVAFLDLDDPTKFVAQGERGELCAKGPQIMLGYYQNEEATEATFVDGWLRTGDVGYVDEDGYVFLVDRIKDLIICSGFNVYPRNIEEAVTSHPAVDECTVIGVPDEYRGEAPVAFVTRKEGEELSVAELKTYLGEHLSKIEMPREIFFKRELPKTLIGKLSKKELRDEYAEIKDSKSMDTPGGDA
jgi:long-chain acyl-CoA synthetase